MEARADATTHKTGVMRQCNKLFRFQNFSSAFIERWGIIDVSGYSSSFNSNTQMQHSSEQVAIYLPYDDETAQIYVDKRLPSHVGVDKFGNTPFPCNQFDIPNFRIEPQKVQQSNRIPCSRICSHRSDRICNRSAVCSLLQVNSLVTKI